MSEPSASAHTCSELRDALLSGEEPDWARVHLETCAGCRELCEPPLRDALTQAALRDIAPPRLDAIQADLDRALEAERGLRRLKSLATPTRIAIALGAIAGLVVLNLLRPRPDIATLGTLALAFPLVVASSLIFLGVRSALRGPHARVQSAVHTGALVGLSAGLPLVYFLSQSFLGEFSFIDSSPGFARRALGCFAYGAGWSLPLGLVLLLLDRNKLASPISALNAGTAGGLSGLIALHLHCPSQHPGHLLLGHLSVLLAMLVAWAVVRGRLRVGAW
ncbi:MAG: hypothetical protein KC766_11715 [Myxococcales bacterium]|nr:hypothetical protein [Myxococcales bacterium]